MPNKSTEQLIEEALERLEEKLKPLYKSGSFDVFNLKVAIEEELKLIASKSAEEERERIKRCLMPVVDLNKCGHEEGSVSVADNLGQYHVASGACRNCGMSMLDWGESQKESL